MTSDIRCRKCSKTILIDEEFLYDDEQPFHLRCFQCSNCHRSLSGEFDFRRKIDGEKRVFCDRCFFRLAPICFFCLKILDEISLKFGEKTFHPLCFRCDRCEKSFKGVEVFPFENEKFCSNCFSKIQNEFCPISSSKIFVERCSTCRKQFQPADVVVSHRFNDVEQFFHSTCFFCGICRRNLSNSTFFSPNGPKEENFTFLCEFCHQNSVESICSACFRPSDDEMILYNDRWFHNDCFVCKKCEFHLKNLSRIYIESDGFLCERCFKLNRN